MKSENYFRCHGLLIGVCEISSLHTLTKHSL
uniref:Uncharacterized protein n=1 Tax=Arundo donax TaxID=35708 RepID=A0A0A8ZPX6_ARUDO